MRLNLKGRMGSGASKGDNLQVFDFHSHYNTIAYKKQNHQVNNNRPSQLAAMSNKDLSSMAEGNPNPAFKPMQAQPPIKPPITSKSEVYDPSKYAQLDRHTLKVPLRLLLGSLSHLITYLLKPTWDDLSKVRVLFRWITSLDIFSLQDLDTPSNSIWNYLQKVRDGKSNHAYLFAGLCRYANLHCCVISGMNKSAAYDIGKDVDRRKMGAQWNAVYIDGQWRFVDCFWASTCTVGRRTGEWSIVDNGEKTGDEDDDEKHSDGVSQHRVNDFFFLTDPDQLIWTHFPDDLQWQLLEKQVSSPEYADHFYAREQFYLFGLTITDKSHKNCSLTTDTGEIDIEFGLPPDRSEAYRFKCVLYQAKENYKSKMELHKFVFYEQCIKCVHFGLRFPISGTFRLDIFSSSVDNFEDFHLNFSYLIKCLKPKENCLPLPSCPFIGYGFGPSALNAGVIPISHMESIIKTQDGNIDIRVSVKKEVIAHQSLHHVMIEDSILINHSLMRMEDGEAIISLRLPQPGEYTLGIYSQKENGEGTDENILNYLIRCESDDVRNIPFPTITGGKQGRSYFAGMLNVVPESNPEGFLQTQNGRLFVRFTAPMNITLRCEFHSNNKAAEEQMQVKTTHDDNEWVFFVDVKVAGEYSLNIFAQNKNDESRIHNVHSYLIEYKSAAAPKENHPQDVIAIATETVETSEKEIRIPVPVGFSKVVAAMHRKKSNDTVSFSKMTFLKQDEKNNILVILPEYGDYILNLYEPSSQSGYKKLAKYQVCRKHACEILASDLKTRKEDIKADADDDEKKAKGKNQKLEEAGDKDTEDIADETETKAESDNQDNRKIRVLKDLKVAIEMKDGTVLEQAIKTYEDLDLEVKESISSVDTDTLKTAKRLLAALQMKSELAEVIEQRNLKALDEILSKVKEVNYDSILDSSIAMAQRIRDHVAKMEKMRHEVLNMEQKTIAELKTYSNPPMGIHEVMLSTFLLLGSSLEQLETWKNIQALMGKTGKESLMRKVSQFDSSLVPLDAATYALEKLEAFHLDDIRAASSGAATFYVWSRAMIEGVKSCGGSQDNTSKGRLKKSRNKLKPK